MTTLLLFLAAAGAAFFLVRGFQLRSGYKSLSQLEIKRAMLDEARAKEEKLSLRQRVRVYLRKQGYEGDMFPFVAGAGFFYLAVLVALRVLGLSYTVGAAAALPVGAGIVWIFTTTSARRRRRRFNHQLIELLELVAGQIEGGNGAQKALQSVVPTMQEPLHSEMSQVLDAQVASKDLIGAMRDLAERYPSRAMDMFIAALEIDRAEGHAIGPALHQAADLLKRDFELANEAVAEISQTRGEFFAVLGILGGISGKMLLTSDPSAHAAYFSAAGLIIIGLGLANVAFGIWRFLKLLSSIRGDS